MEICCILKIIKRPEYLQLGQADVNTRQNFEYDY